jgi:ribosomal RNA-processing protein 9
MHKKKPLFTVQAAHGVDEPEPLEKVSSEMDEEVLARLREADTRREVPRDITALASLQGTDVVVSGSWDGWIRIWKVSNDKRSLISLGVVGKQETAKVDMLNGLVNGHTNGETMAQAASENQEIQGPVKGVINSLAIFERRKQIQNEFGGKKEGESLGLCIVAGTGKEMRLGRWKKFAGGKNGAVVLEVPLRLQEKGPNEGDVD